MVSFEERFEYVERLLVQLLITNSNKEVFLKLLEYSKPSIDVESIDSGGKTKLDELNMLLLKVLELGVEDVVGNRGSKGNFIEELWVALNYIVEGVVSKGEVDFFVFRAFVGAEDDLSHVLLH